MSSVVISGDTSGAITLAAPAVSGTNTATLPAATGTVMVSGNMPAFSAYQSSSQTIATNTTTKILFQTEEFDTNNCFASSTFTPTVAGYYQVTASIGCGVGFGSGVEVILSIAKNGSVAKYLWDISSNIAIMNGTVLLYLNGSTDYIEVFFIQYSGGNKSINANSQVTYFQAELVRTA